MSFICKKPSRKKIRNKNAERSILEVRKLEFY
jgi:hypothetical protein